MGGGLYFSSSGTIFNNTIVENTASSAPVGTSGGYGGGIWSSTATLANNTIVGNTASHGGGVYHSSGTTLVNNIVAFNSSGLWQAGSGTSTLRNNCVYNPFGLDYSGVAAGQGDISVDPGLVGAPYGKVHLRADSVCIDRGDDSIVQAGWMDMDREARLQGNHIDIGADEFNGIAPSFMPVIVRVRPDGNDANDGSSWESAKRTVQAGIDSASNAGGGDVWVAAGTYSERITLKGWAHLYGGFAAAESARDERDWVRNSTILDGGAAGSVVTASAPGCGTSTIDGFTIRNGTGTPCAPYVYGGGIFCNASSPLITNSTIASNAATGPLDYGDGIYCSSASCPMIVRNRITANKSSTDFFGSAVYCASHSSPLVVNNLITGNVTTGGMGPGGAIFCGKYSFPTISNNRIEGNSGGAVYCDSNSSVTIRNNVIAGHTPWSGGTICCQSSSLTTVANNTIVANGGTSSIGAVFGGSSTLVVNNIIAFNSIGVYTPSGGGAPVLRNNCVYNPGGADYVGLTAGTADVSADPRLTALAYGELHLGSGSPCIDAGDDTAVLSGSTDIDGQARVQGGHVDIGADESVGAIPWAGPAAVRVTPDGDDGNDGSSWQRAMKTVQAGIDVAANVGGEVWVAAGTYKERIHLRVWTHVYGGFAGSETFRDQRDWKTRTTILDGEMGGSVVTAVATGLHVSTIDGFTIRNGSGTASNLVNQRYGGGIYVFYASPVISNNTMAANTVSAGGGGSAARSGPPSSATTSSLVTVRSGAVVCTYPEVLPCYQTA